MKTLYRTSFVIKRERSLEQIFDDVATVCLRWVFEPKRGGVAPLGLDVNKADTIEKTTFANRMQVEAHYVMAENGTTRAWGLRFIHPQHDDPCLQWTSEMGLLAKGENNPTFSCSVGVSRTDPTLTPLRQRPSRPRIVPIMLRQFNCFGAYKLSPEPIDLRPTKTGLDTFMSILQDKHRTHPIIYISVKNNDNLPLVNTAILADSLAGIAHVLVATDAKVSWLFCDKMPHSGLIAYNGAVRLYWPKFDLTDSQFDHPLWSKNEIEGYTNSTGELTQRLLDLISSTAVYNLHDGILTWDKLQSMARSIAIEEAKSAGNNGELITLFEEENHTLNEKVSQLQRQLAQQSEEVKKQRNLADVYRIALESKKAGDNEAALDIPVANISQVIERAAKQHSERMSFCFNGKSQHQECLFDAPEEVEKAFNWLGTVYFRAKTAEKSCADLDKALRETIPGWSYSGGQKRASVSKYQEWYTTNYKGKEYWIGEHIGCGKSKDPRETIRIAFNWDKDLKRTIVGFLGQHQKTSNT